MNLGAIRRLCAAPDAAVGCMHRAGCAVCELPSRNSKRRLQAAITAIFARRARKGWMMFKAAVAADPSHRRADRWADYRAARPHLSRRKRRDAHRPGALESPSRTPAGKMLFLVELHQFHTPLVGRQFLEAFFFFGRQRVCEAFDFFFNVRSAFGAHATAPAPIALRREPRSLFGNCGANPLAQHFDALIGVGCRFKFSLLVGGKLGQQRFHVGFCNFGHLYRRVWLPQFPSQAPLIELLSPFFVAGPRRLS